MKGRVLFVDDEVNILNAYKRTLRKLFDIDTAESGLEALKKLKSEEPFAVIVSDMRMPGMDGIELLEKTRKLYPEMVRIMLTGNSDQETAVNAVNKGDIFRFLNKPCQPEEMAMAIKNGLEQHRLIVSEKELLNNTLTGSIKVLNEVLSLVNPEAFGKTHRIQELMMAMAEVMGVRKEWWLQPLVQLSQIGCVILPPDVLNKVAHGESLREEEEQLFKQHPLFGADLLSKIPRMDKISEAIRYQEKHFNGVGNPMDGKRGEEIPLPSRMLKIVLDYERQEVLGMSKKMAFMKMKKREGFYDPKLMNVLEAVLIGERPLLIKKYHAENLEPGMVLWEGIKTSDGTAIVYKGQVITAPLIAKLKNFKANHNLIEPILIKTYKDVEYDKDALA